MVYVFEHVLELLETFGLFRVILPWLLIFAIFYAVLMKTKLLGDTEANTTVKNINAIIAAVAGFLVIAATPVVEALNALIPQAAYLIVVCLLFMMAMAFFVKTDTIEGLFANKKLLGIILLVFVFIFLGIIDMTAGFHIPVIHELVLVCMGQAPLVIPYFPVDVLVSLLVIIAIPLLVIYFIMAKKK